MSDGNTRAMSEVCSKLTINYVSISEIEQVRAGCVKSSGRCFPVNFGKQTFTEHLKVFASDVNKLYLRFS